MLVRQRKGKGLLGTPPSWTSVSGRVVLFADSSAKAEHCCYPQMLFPIDLTHFPSGSAEQGAEPKSAQTPDTALIFYFYFKSQNLRDTFSAV